MEIIFIEHNIASLCIENEKHAKVKLKTLKLGSIMISLKNLDKNDTKHMIEAKGTLLFQEDSWQ